MHGKGNRPVVPLEGRFGEERMIERNSVICADCLPTMQGMDENAIDAIVTDPPYGLSFMGKDWDHGIPGIHFWQEALRVCKPGAHMLAFGGTRTHHRLMVAIEDAGWEIRDTLGYLYGSGFPKSLNISKQLDKEAGAEREVIGESQRGSGAQPNKLNAHGKGDTGIGYADGSGKTFDITAPATDAAKQWNGWGTALKPSWEPVILCRKPLEGTVAENVQKWGTGGINIDGCRISGEPWKSHDATGLATVKFFTSGDNPVIHKEPHIQGRFPANIIHDGSDEVMALFPESKGQSGDIKGTEQSHTGDENTTCYGEFGRVAFGKRNDSGSAARFFYTAKADSGERNKYLNGRPGIKVNDGREAPIDNAFQRGETLRKNIHPTVKPIDLMQYLCRLITPPKGLILDPFAGSGSTGVAAHNEGFDYILIEIEKEYAEIARIRNAQVRLLV